ncbi:ATP-dependent DNA helicase RecG [Candidatus Kinetoplastibacterium sorsogonicusi]|uniref:ATP-dependent DNA helicase RecG n=1 Tax=Candidatus Kinetoplastidibacterium kentomonadis TaxID=1576550 RepID=A0A3Q8EWZ1_9PROT|nr:ATP-dependent DNA helicase RecG [Candidatus Kinetoplastibacterium sorsogonicusi]AWD32453.1 ATP-dependent DNA helicase RecG [Candidatus Kinetoplastibacterium sorsogonicusi]
MKISNSLNKNEIGYSDFISSENFLFFFPIKYQNLTIISKIIDLKIGEKYQIEGIIKNVNITLRPRKQLCAIVADDTGELQIRWLNFYPNLIKKIKIHNKIRLSGTVRKHINNIEIVHPDIINEKSILPTKLTPIYCNIFGLKVNDIKKIIYKLINEKILQETLPKNIIESYNLLSINDAVHTIHFPEISSDIKSLINKTHPAWLRIKFDELVARNLSILSKKNIRFNCRAIPLMKKETSINKFINNLPFSLTNSQIDVIKEISNDLTKPYPMHRILQGDVGSGKTIVAAIAILQAIKNKTQAVLMTPTEILSEQHFKKFSSWFNKLGINIGILTSSQKQNQKNITIQKIVTGEIDLIIGTQAILQDKIIFNRLGLSIIDEQHKFGVWQRSSLKYKNFNNKEYSYIPHQLAMSATPIPRTLAMVILSDIDISTIYELPKGRKPITTKLISNNKKYELIKRIKIEISLGKQAYWVCPIIDQSNKLTLQNVMHTYQEISSALPDINIGIIHGKLTQTEKSAVMNSFIEGNIKILVATTIIEVGVDIENASIMVIENAERFGLAQLHQLRGRIGRGTQNSTCILLYQDPLSEIAMDRLKAMFYTNNGFEIAKKDLQQRGPGEFLGTKQSGDILFKFVDIELDKNLIEPAKQASIYIYENNKELANKHIERWKFISYLR